MPTILILKTVEDPEWSSRTNCVLERPTFSKGGYEVVWEKFGRRAESLARGVIPRGPFDPIHVPLLIPSGTSLSHGNAMKMSIVLLLSKRSIEPPGALTRSDT